MSAVVRLIAISAALARHMSEGVLARYSWEPDASHGSSGSWELWGS
jgi:hypothetical protein